MYTRKNGLHNIEKSRERYGKICSFFFSFFFLCNLERLLENQFKCFFFLMENTALVVFVGSRRTLFIPPPPPPNKIVSIFDKNFPVFKRVCK